MLFQVAVAVLGSFGLSNAAALHLKPAPPSVLNDAPIIGILSLPVDGKSQSFEKFSYIAASYVKWLEGGGARTVPIPYDSNPEDIRNLFYSLNGIVFTGGASVEEPKYYQAGQLLFNLTVEAAGSGDYVPLWGTCLGFEFITMLASGNPNVLDEHLFDANNFSLPLTFTQQAEKSRLYGPLVGTDLWNVFRHEAVTANEHEHGISPDRFSQQGLDKFYRVTSLNRDRNGLPFVSSIEAYEYPIYGVQWHPEKVQYEWERHHDTSHTANAIKASQYTAEFLVNEARRNGHHFPSEAAEDKALFYNHVAEYTYPATHGHFAQMYYFPAQA
eukprot:comp21396_c0_seq1/m.29455 comp21396_c0_seq1/g.29455  ORF comp21396_c0_seq1/g.29455 comp21396_c0_seq1/m.29455 type:complete len:328 (-) comp21396_c0_seq1:474-1457(-)